MIPSTQHLDYCSNYRSNLLPLFMPMIISKEWMKFLRFSLKLIEDAPIEFWNARYIKINIDSLSIQASDWFIFGELKRVENMKETFRTFFRLNPEENIKSILIPRSKIHYLSSITTMEIKTFKDENDQIVNFLYVFENNDKYVIVDDFIFGARADEMEIWYEKLENEIFSGEKSLFDDWKPQLIVSQIKIRFDKAINEADKNWFYDIWEKYIVSEGSFYGQSTLSYKIVMATQKKFE